MSKNWQTKDAHTLKKYNALDCVVTARVYQKMRREISTARQQNMYAHNQALSRLAAKMHNVGFKVHAENRAFLAWGLEQEYGERLTHLKQLVGIKAFEGTENHMRALIWKRHRTEEIHRFDLPDPIDDRMWNDDRTQIKVDFGTLLQLVTNPGQPQDLKDIIDAYWAADEIWKLRSTFVTSRFIDQAIGEDGRLRAGWNSLGTDTGRWTCSKPNIANVKQFIRDMYCAEEGKVLVHADFSQQELWVMAAVAGDKELFRRLRDIDPVTGKADVYAHDARDWFRLPKDMDVKKTKPRARQQCKIIHLASQYGAGVKTIYLQALADDRTFTFKATQLLNQGFLKTYSDTAQYWEDEMARIARDGYAETRIMQRRKVFPRMPDRSQAVNYPIQGTAADISNLALLEIDRRLTDLPGANIVHQLYDANDIECWEDDVDRVKKIQRESMCNPVRVGNYTLEIPVEQKVSKLWGEL